MRRIAAFILIPLCLLMSTTYAQTIENFAGGNMAPGFISDPDEIVIMPSDIEIDRDSKIYFRSLGLLIVYHPLTNSLELLAGDGTSTTYTEGMDIRDLPINPIPRIDSDNNIYLSLNDRIVQFDPDTYALTTVAGTGINGDSGDGGRAILAEINAHAITLNPNGDILFIQSETKIRKIDKITGIISTLIDLSSTGIEIGPPYLAADSNGMVYFFTSDDDFLSTNLIQFDPTANTYRRVDNAYGEVTTLKYFDGFIYTMVHFGYTVSYKYNTESLVRDEGPYGTEGCYIRGDDETDNPYDLTFDMEGKLYLTMAANPNASSPSPWRLYQNMVLESMDQPNYARTSFTRLIGNPYKKRFGDGGVAVESVLDQPTRLAMSPSDELYILDQNSVRGTYQGSSLIRAINLNNSIINSRIGYNQSAPTGGCVFVDDYNYFTFDNAGKVWFSASGFQHINISGEKFMKYDPVTGIITSAPIKGSVYEPLAHGTRNKLFSITGNNFGIPEDPILILNNTETFESEELLDLSFYDFNISEMVADSRDRLWMIEQNTNSIYRYDSRSRRLLHIAGVGHPLIKKSKKNNIPLNNPTAITLDQDENVFFSETGTISRIHRGSLRLTLVVSGITADGLAFDSEGNLYASDKGADLIRKISDLETPRGLGRMNSYASERESTYTFVNPMVVPNPAIDVIRIAGAPEGSYYRIIDKSNKVLQQGYYGDNQSLNLRDLNPGLYIIQLTYENKTITRILAKE